MDILLASNNRKKIEEIRRILSSSGENINVSSLSDIGYHDEIDEFGDTFEENSLIKASVAAGLGYVGIADDSGLTTDALSGAPGVYSARYAGVSDDSVRDAANRQKLLKELSGVPTERRTAGFSTVISVVFPEGYDVVIPEELRPSASAAAKAGVDPARCISVFGECRGKIGTEEKGSNGFGYDSLFISDDLGKTFAEAGNEEKNSVSHRGRAMRKLAAALESLAGSDGKRIL